MGANLSRLNYLLQRYTDDAATPSERLELMEALKDEAQEESVRQWLLATLERYDAGGRTAIGAQDAGSDIPDLSEEKAEQVLTQILQSEREDPEYIPAEVVPMRQRWRRRAWMAAAAVLLLVAGVGGYRQLTGGNKQVTIAARAVKQDVAPGKHAAVLTLAGGRRVLLDSSISDTVGRQGNTTIINMKGLLAFQGQPAGSASELVYNTLTTNSGNQYQLILPDGSKVWLNAASSIRFPVSFGAKERKVEVTGEAYFEVVTNANRPFLVQHENTMVKVLGTSFNINTYADERALTATLLEGAIAVGVDGNNKVIRPGQQARIGAGGGISILDNVSTEEVVAWKNDLFFFRSADIGTIMRQLARWYDIQIAYQGEDIGERFYAKLPRSVHLSEALDALSLTGKVHFELEGKKVIVRP
jgi:transmembrane sensor